MSTTTEAVAGRRARAREGSALAIACGAAFLSLLDATIANVAVADLHRDFPDASLSDLSWVITLYAITFAALLAPGGRLADVVGRRALLIGGVATFTTMSLACAVAPTLGVLLAARALQGAGAAAMIPASLAVVLADTAPEHRAKAIGTWSAAGALAAAAGPALGGILVDVAGWRSAFYISVPLGAALLAGAQLLPVVARVGGRVPDPFGVALLGAGVGLAALGVSQGAAWGWADERTLAALAGGGVAIAAALGRSRRHPAPAIETSLWRSRPFALANVASLFYGACLFAWLLCAMLFLTQVWDYRPLQAGLAVSPGAVVATVVALRCGPLVARFGPRPVIVSGAVALIAVAVVMGVAVPQQPDFLGFWLPVGTLVGVGMGAVTTGTSAAAALSVAPQRFAAAVGLNQTARQVGGALGVATLATMLHTADAGSAATYRHVFLFCAIATAASALAATWLVLRPAEATA